MTVSPERIANASDWPFWSHPEGLTKWILGKDDKWRSEHPATVSSDEPKLPPGVTYDNTTTGKSYAYHDPTPIPAGGRSFLYVESWTPDEVEQVARHMRWRAAQSAKPACDPCPVCGSVISNLHLGKWDEHMAIFESQPIVTDAMVEAALKIFAPHNATSYKDFCHEMREAIAAALAAQKGEK